MTDMHVPAWTWSDYARCARAEAARASQRMRVAPLEMAVTDGRLVISIGVETLARMFEAQAAGDTGPVALAALTAAERGRDGSVCHPPQIAGEAPAPAIVDAQDTSPGVPVSEVALTARPGGVVVGFAPPPQSAGKAPVPANFPMPQSKRELPATPAVPAAEDPRSKVSDLAPAGVAAKPAGDRESPQMRRARELLGMGLHLNDVRQAVRLSRAELAMLGART